MKSNDVRSISVEEWSLLAKDGIDLEIRIQLYGNSMVPLIRRKKDYVVIHAFNRPLKRGDIVLFHRGDNSYVVHRVWKIHDSQIQTMGDNCYSPDIPILQEEVLGLITQVHRGNCVLYTDTKIGRCLGILWLTLMPLRRRLRKLLRPLKQSLRNIVRR